MAARMAGLAREIGYPDMRSVLYRTLACRPSADESWGEIERYRSTVTMAMILALTDPLAAKELLRSVEHRTDLLGGGGSSTINRREWYIAWALADPLRAEEMVTRELEANRNNAQFKLDDSLLYVVPQTLSLPPSRRAPELLRHNYAMWFPGEE